MIIESGDEINDGPAGLFFWVGLFLAMFGGATGAIAILDYLFPWT